jgi:6-pyruvoyltetrahydropterin/6-carboxytetrahydropterin synthase
LDLFTLTLSESIEEEFLVRVIQVQRYHDFSYGHRIVGGGRCENPHGHNARVTFTLEGTPDETGHVIGFEWIKKHYCQWLEDNWDHKMLLHHQDLLFKCLHATPFNYDSVVYLPCHPTAENLANHLFTMLKINAPLPPNGVSLMEIKWEETRKCAVIVKEVSQITSI